MITRISEADHTVRYKNIKPPYYIPETNITNVRLYTNHNYIFRERRHLGKISVIRLSAAKIISNYTGVH